MVKKSTQKKKKKRTSKKQKGGVHQEVLLPISTLFNMYKLRFGKKQPGNILFPPHTKSYKILIQENKKNEDVAWKNFKTFYKRHMGENIFDNNSGYDIEGKLAKIIKQKPILVPPPPTPPPLPPVGLQP